MYTVMQVETYLCLLCSVRKIYFGSPPPTTTTYMFLRPHTSLTRGQKSNTFWGPFLPRSTLNILVIFYWNFLLGGSHLWPLSVNMSTSIIWCDSNKKVQYFSVWLWYTLCSPLMAYHHNDRLCEKVSWLLPNHIPIKLLFLFSTQLN